MAEQQRRRNDPVFQNALFAKQVLQQSFQHPRSLAQSSGDFFPFAFGQHHRNGVEHPGPRPLSVIVVGIERDAVTFNLCLSVLPALAQIRFPQHVQLVKQRFPLRARLSITGDGFIVNSGRRRVRVEQALSGTLRRGPGVRRRC